MLSIYIMFPNPIQAATAFNKLYSEEPALDAPVRVPPSNQLDVARPEQAANILEQKQSESADPLLAADDEDSLTVTTLLEPTYAEGTRDDEEQLAQREGAAAQRRTGGDRPDPKFQYDENGEAFWEGPDGPESDALPGGGVPKMARAAVSQVAQAAVEPLAAAAGGAKDAVGDAVGNPLTDVAQGIGALGTGMAEGLVKQMNTMLIILGLAYVAGQAVGGKGS